MGAVTLHPNLINVIAVRAKLTVDLRNTDETLLQQAEQRFAHFLRQLADDEGAQIEARSLARFEPVLFDPGMADLVADTARQLGHTCRPMTSGAGHDAQMLARICPSAMIFVPSFKGISHTEPAHLSAGADVLLHTLLELAK